MFYEEEIYCYFKPASGDGDFCYDDEGNEYIAHESNEGIAYVEKSDQTWIIKD